MLSTILLTILCLSTTNADIENSKCPCKVYVDANGTQTANCYQQKITSIPNCVPNSTQHLDLTLNNILYSPGQFQRFEHLVVLIVILNKEFAAHIDSFQFLFKLEKLYLGYTDLTHVNEEMFRDQAELRELDLRGPLGDLNVSQSLFNHLGKLETLLLGMKADKYFTLLNWTFVRLSILQELDLSITSSLLLQNNAFYGLSALKFLNMGIPVYTISLPVEVFKPLISLEELHLEGLSGVMHPSFDFTTIDERLTHIPSLERLYIDNKFLSHLGKGFLSLRNLQELYLASSINGQCCEMRQLESDNFINLRNSPLTKLVVSNCNIGILWTGWLKYLTELKEISFSVATIEYTSFWGTFAIDLHNTSINTVSLSLASTSTYAGRELFAVPDDFNETRLTFLEITDTKYYIIDDDTLYKLPKSLKHFNLTRNCILYFGVDNLKYLENLETLDLSNQDNCPPLSLKNNEHNTLHFTSQTNFEERYVSNLININDNNMRGIIEFRDKIQKRLNITTETKGRSLPHRLKVLDLSQSSLLCNMVPAFFDSNNSLRILKASNQRDTTCFETLSIWSALKNLAKLEELILNGNLISDIPVDTFSGLYNLRSLLLKNNKLLELSFYVKDLVSLETMDLSANSIAYVSNILTNQIEDVSENTNLTLILDSNPLVCNCKHLHFVTWLGVTQLILNKRKLNCTFENGTRINIGEIFHIHDLWYKCTMLDVTISCSTIFLGLNIILGSLAYIWHKRQKLKYLVAFGKRTLNPYHPIEDNEIQMEYDVYISYEGDFNVTRDMTLRDFVIHTILPGLERRGIKVIIREELDAGSNLYEVITQTVRRSKKVLALLSNGYCSDMWNVFEFNQAVMEGIYTNRQVAIPVLFESLRRDQVKEEICEFLRMEPVHRYSPELRDGAFIDFLYEKIRDTRLFG